MSLLNACPTLKSKSKDMPLIGVGGVMSQKNDFNEKIDAGASLVQLYTGFILKDQI